MLRKQARMRVHANLITVLVLKNIFEIVDTSRNLVYAGFYRKTYKPTINIVLLADILRRSRTIGRDRDTHVAMRLLKMFLVLMPIFGINLILSPINLLMSSPYYFVYNFFKYLLKASQDIFVAIVFCFANQDVSIY
ncbi:hypothetical protein Ciccas_009733 [Cichlidogyrus casuarinus]|uniref:G-protein coupled receptors family 1 profile domain-containing protein n=1 Tax=Cichlidogyrus casuarinus TaxID=1844966 RepID=A0ABD2PX71_9PLAT